MELQPGASTCMRSSPLPCPASPCTAAEVLAQLRYDLPATYKFHK